MVGQWNSIIIYKNANLKTQSGPYDSDYLLVIIGLLSQIVYKLNVSNYCDQSNRSIPPKLPTFTGHPKWQCGRSILNVKTKNEFVFLTLLLKTKKEFGVCFSFANLKTKKEKTVYTRTQLINTLLLHWNLSITHYL